MPVASCAEFVGIEAQYKIKLGENVEMHVGKLMEIYIEEIKKQKQRSYRIFKISGCTHVAERQAKIWHTKMAQI